MLAYNSLLNNGEMPPFFLISIYTIRNSLCETKLILPLKEGF